MTRTPATVTEADWNDWRWQLAHRARTASDLAARLTLSPLEREAFACADLPAVAVTPYYLDVMDPADPACPIRRQALPHPEDARSAPSESPDPLGERQRTPVPGLVHRYPDRVVLLAAPDCPVRCRHCNRRRRHAGEFLGRSPEALAAVEAYLRATPAVREVILSGGDPLTLDDAVLHDLLGRLRRIDSVETLRVHTRAPVTCPMRVTDDLVRLLRSVAPLHLVTQFNHPRELTPEALAACGRLVDAGVPVASQGVLLRGVNADPDVLVDLLRGLHRGRIRPLYLFQLDPVVGTERFRTRVRDSIALVGGLRGRISGLAIPQLVLDAPGGHGKVALLPESIVSESPGVVRVRTYSGAEVDYPDTGEPVPA